MRLKIWRGDDDIEIELWDTQVEVLSWRWKAFLKLKREKEDTLASLSEVSVTVSSAEKSGSETDKGAGMVGVETKNVVAAPSKDLPSPATDATTSSAVTVTAAILVKVEVMALELDELPETS